MDESINLTLRIIGLGVLIALSAFFSGAETALFSLSRLRIKQLQKRVVRS